VLDGKNLQSYSGPAHTQRCKGRVNVKKLQRGKGLRQRAYEMIRSHISLGKIKPAQRLIEGSVAIELGISRTPVREALAMLALEGLLVPTTRGFVLPAVTEADAAEICQLRRLLEPVAFGDAVANASPEGVAEMRKALAEQRRAHTKGDLNGFVLANARFRKAWLSMVPNRRLVAAVALYGDHVQVLRIRLGLKATRRIVIDGMIPLVRAAEIRDRDSGFAAMAKHVAAAEVETRILARDQQRILDMKHVGNVASAA
jgi:DNA-binding GntR family transcriptional regulator